MISAGVSFQGKARLHFIEEKNKNQRRLLRKPVVAKISGRLSPVVWPTVYLPTRWSAYVSSKSDSAVACSPLSRLDKDSWPPNSPDINPLDYYVWRADAWGALSPASATVGHPGTEVSALMKIWNELPQDAIWKSIANFRNRLWAFRNADGWRFEHLL